MVEPLLLGEQARLSASLGESHFREFKSGLEGPPGSKKFRDARTICRDVAEALVAFANADGGELLVGVEDSGDITGLGSQSEAHIEMILAAPKTHVHKDTPLRSVGASRLTIDGNTVLYFRVPKSISGIHLTSDGKCLRRSDLESVPVSPQQIQFDRKEAQSIQYDRDYVDGATLADLDVKLTQVVSDQITRGMSPEKFLQYLDLADYDSAALRLRLRRAALLLFANKPDRWHPRCQVRIIKVQGNTLGAGAAYNVASDATVSSNVMRLVDDAWEQLRPHLVQTRLGETARFQVTSIYPENACREALTNAIAHRDYSEEGRGIEIYVFDDRIEIKNPGGLLSTISVTDLQAMKGVHQSRNAYIARALRETGFMRELGEGMRRIFELMKSNELAPPDIESQNDSFTLRLHHRPMYSAEEVFWLSQYDRFTLNPEQKAILLLGRKGSLIAPKDIWDRLGIVDTDHYRSLVASLQQLRILETAVPKIVAQKRAKASRVSVREIARFKVTLPQESSASKKKVRRQKQSEEFSVSSDRSASREEQGDATIFVGNLPPSVNQRDLISSFQSFGTIESVYLPALVRDKPSRASRILFEPNRCV